MGRPAPVVPIPHVPGSFYRAAPPPPPVPAPAPAPLLPPAPAPPPLGAPVGGIPPASRRRRGRGAGGIGRGRGRGRGAGGVGRGVRRRNPPMAFQSYDDQDVGNPLPAFTPNRLPGIHFGRPLLRNTMTKAVEFFHLFFTDEMVRNICDHTNSYAIEHISYGTHRTYAQPDGSWKETTPDEINRLIAILIYFGLVKVHTSTDRYWSVKSLYHGLWARAIMPRIRFRALMSLLHVVDPATETPGDKLRKVQSFIDDFKSKCLSLYQPRQQVAIDERMVKSRHRSGIRQYIKDKPTKWGLKLWVLADSSNGYTVDFNIYIGKGAQQVGANGLGYDVVMRLMQPFFNQGYHLYIDNFYTSSVLVKDLFQEGVAVTGTIRENSRGFPAGMKNGSQWSKAGNVERGSMRWERDPPILALQWLDNKVVSMLSTIENANDRVQVERKSRTDGQWRTIAVTQPQAIASYNKYMNAVDRSDQILATNNVLRKCMRWWKTLFLHLIDIAVVNSFILFREHQAQFPDVVELQRTADYSLAHFREEIVRQICGFEEYEDPPVYSSAKQAAPGEFDTVHMPVFSDDVRRNCVVCYKREGRQLRVSSYCSAPQCEGNFMHVTKEQNCFKEFHSREYHRP